MMKSHYKSLPVFMQKAAEVTESDSGAIIHDVVIVQKGVDKVGDYIDDKFISDIIEMGNAQSQGVKSRFGHPNMCKDSLGTYLGRFRNFRKNDEGNAIADLQLDKVAIKSPEGDLYSYILEMAKSNHDQFGNSIVFAADDEPIELEENGEKRTYSKLNLKAFIASDLVDSPAATTSLFKSTEDLGAALTEFIDDNPSVLDVIASPVLLKSFFGRYATYYEKKHNKTFDMGILDKIKAALGNSQKNVDVTLADGTIATVVTDQDQPQVGDAVQVDGAPAPDGEHLLADGTTITTEGGVITEIAEPEEEEVEVEEASTEQVEQLSTEQVVAKSLAPIAEQLEAIQKSLESQADRLKENEDALMLIAKRTKSESVVPPVIKKSSSDPEASGKVVNKPVRKKN